MILKKLAIPCLFFFGSILILNAQDPDYLIICPDDILDAATGLKEYRESTGHTVALTGLSEILQENPLSAENIDDWIEDFLAGHPSVRFITLVGDIESIPTYYGEYSNTQFDSDLWYSIENDSLNQDYLPRVALGRIPVKNSNQLDTYLNKIIAYETSSEDRNTILFYGNEAEMNYYAKRRDMEIAFAQGFDTIALVNPSEEELFGILNSEPIRAVLYYGHGSYLSNYPLMISNLLDWNNTDHPVLFFSGGCSFNDNVVTTTPIGDSLVLAENGSVSSVGASINGGYGSDYQLIEGILLKLKCFSTLGELYNDAMQYHYETSENSIGSWCYYFHRRMNFIGDPGLVINPGLSPLDTTYLSESICQGETVFVGGQACTQTGNYTVTLASQHGCDSVVNLDLTVYPVFSADLSASVCQGEQYELGGEAFTEEGIYQVTMTSQHGCDSVVNLDLTVVSIDAGVSVQNDSILAHEEDATYQWLDCQNGYIPVPGETARLFVANESGNYAVEITLGTCRDTSECVVVTVGPTGLNEQAASPFSIYPNPVGQVVTIETGTAIVKVKLDVVSSSGKKILSRYYPTFNRIDLDLSGYPEGIYLFRFTLADGRHETYRVIKH